MVTMVFWPSMKQWQGWTLPSKASYVGAVVSLVGLLLALTTLPYWQPNLSNIITGGNSFCYIHMQVGQDGIYPVVLSVGQYNLQDLTMRLWDPEEWKNSTMSPSAILDKVKSETTKLGPLPKNDYKNLDRLPLPAGAYKQYFAEFSALNGSWVQTFNLRRSPEGWKIGSFVRKNLKMAKSDAEKMNQPVWCYEVDPGFPERDPNEVKRVIRDAHGQRCEAGSEAGKPARMPDWLWNNREWVFSGIGVFVLGWIVGLIRHAAGLFGKQEREQSAGVQQHASPVMMQNFNPTITVEPTVVIPAQSIPSPAPHLKLAFDKHDPSCVRTWPGIDPHHLYRLRVTNCGGNTAHQVRVVIERVFPLRQDILNAKLGFMHREGPNMATMELGPKQPGYFDLLEYNSRDANTGRPVILVWHTIPHVPVQLDESDHYEFTLKAYSREASSETITVSFGRRSPTDYHFEQHTSSTSHPERHEEMVFEDSVYWKLKNGTREGPYCPTCYDDKHKEIHLNPGATRGTYFCGVCQNGFDLRPTKHTPPRGRRRR